MRRINSLYGRIGILKRALEKPRSQSHTFLAYLSFSTDGGYGGGGESQQTNSSRVKIFNRDLKRDCKKSFPSASCLGGSLGAVQRLLRTWSRFVAQDAQEDSLDKSIETSYLVGDEEFPPYQREFGRFDHKFVGAPLDKRSSTIHDRGFPFSLLLPVELRIACTLAHMKREGGISPRLSPLAQVCV
ncbi:unnamed protein product [Eruca vesicaria subsp. sativa]|uniref:Uncharacterized protein n=1 Tax=Eruca vesicaria subsp. sativa TaxID=29727 RepID=A0ABC8KIZ4_ERUVS|nr:unnamed protein product [Eruca vesicaria subsp. sativa]